MIKSPFKWFMVSAIGVVLSAVPVVVSAQTKMDLEDISIKGELHNDDRLRMLARERNRLRNYVKYRTNFRQEMIQGLMKPEPQVSYQPLGPASGGLPLDEEN